MDQAQQRIPWNILDKDQLGYDANFTEKSELLEPHDGPRVTARALSDYQSGDNTL